MIQDLEQRQQDRQNGQANQRVNTTNMNATEASIQKRIQAMEDSKKESLLSKAANSNEREILSNVDVDTSSLEKKFLDMVLKSVSEEDLSKVGHGLNEMLKHCRWSSFNCKEG